MRGGGNLYCNWAGDSVAMAAGDVITVQVAPSGITTVSNSMHLGLRFDMATANTFMTATCTDQNMNDNQRMYGSLISGQFTASATETGPEVLTLSPFVQAKSIYAWLSADPGTSPDAYTYTIRGDTIGDGNLDQANDDTACAVTVTANATTGAKTDCTDRIYFSEPTFAIGPNNSTQTVSMDSAWGMGWTYLGKRTKGETD